LTKAAMIIQQQGERTIYVKSSNNQLAAGKNNDIRQKWQ